MTTHYDRKDGEFRFECDGCDTEPFDYTSEDFSEAWGAAKRDGWRAEKVGEEWLHLCPDCQRKRQ